MTSKIKKRVPLVSKTKCPNEPVELGMPSSYKCKKSESSTGKQSEPREYAYVDRNSMVTNKPANMSGHSMSCNKSKKMKLSIRIQTELEQDAVGSQEDNIVNVEDESYEDTAMELQHLGLEARIWRLERIFDMIKAARFGASSRTNLDK